MQWDEWLDFLSSEDIRVKGTRVGIEAILYDHIHRARTPEEIAAAYPTVTLAQVYGALFYYHTHKMEMDRYLTDWLEWGFEQRTRQANDPHYQGLRQRLLERSGRKEAV